MTFRKTAKTTMLAAAVVALLASASAFADEMKLKGMITTVQGDTVTIRDANNAEQTFNVSGDTVFKKTKGLTGVVHDKVEKGALMAGLPVTAEIVDGVATEVSFKSEDLKTAQQVSAGLAPTHERMDQFGTYESIFEAEVHFASGKTAIDSKGKADLMALAAKAKETKDYRVVIQGFTDSTGNAAANQRLSTMRAAAVQHFLQQKAGLSPGRVTTPDGMGIAPDAGSGSNENARKVVAKLVIDKGVHGSQ
jgi:outer membrane protein OmpA-like peptidoglycan-associated protein